MAQHNSAQQLYDLLVSRNFDPELLDSSGRPSKDPSETEIFSFDFQTESGNDYGTVVIMLGDDNDMEIYFGDNVGRGMEVEDKKEWFDFLYQLRMFAKRNLMTFGLKNLNRLRYSMQGQAALKEGLFESWSGKKDVSWNASATESRLMIKHKRNLGEGEARFRCVESLFIETTDGERYKLPFRNLTAGKAMLEHVRNGGKPYDVRGQHIAEMVNELNVLSRFRRANHGRIFEGDTAALVEQTNAYYETARSTLKSLTTKSGYNTYFESWDPEQVTEQELVIEGLKHLFITQTLDQRIEEALPLLARIQQQGTEMKEANIFEAWAEKLVEGTWATPDTPEKRAQLTQLMSAEFPVGPDATNATEQLYDLIGDDQLFDRLETLANTDANADARQIIYDRMQELSNDPDVRAAMSEFTMDDKTSADTDGDTVDEPPVLEQSDYVEYQDSLEDILKRAGVDDTVIAAPDYETDLTEGTSTNKKIVNENVLTDGTGSTLGHILDRFKHEVRNFQQSGELDEQLYDALFDYYFDLGEIPYGIAKARDGDPHEWVATNLQSHLSGGGIVGGNPDEDMGMERESAGDYAEEKNAMRKLAGMASKETDEGILGTVGGGLAGLALGGPLGAIAGAGLGQAVTDGGSGIIEQGDEETDEGWKGQLAGGTVGTLAGGALGALGGPIGAAFGGAVGGTAGQMIGDKLGGEETDEGVRGAVAGGALGGVATRSVKGAVAGAKLGSAIQDRFAKNEETSPLAGQYGHSGKMKEVGKDISFLDRLKELSGMKK